MTLTGHIKCAVEDALKHLFPDTDTSTTTITINETKPEFTGDYTVVLFPFVKLLRQKPDELGKILGNYLVEKTTLFSEYAIVSGFLNLTIKDGYWINFLLNHFNDTKYGEQNGKDNRVMVEYSSPNTNKPLHFGHLRNIFLGYAAAEISKAAGNQVIKANLINDRGIHICKSMIAWERYGNGDTPERTGIKGDHLVGEYYVKFNDVLNEEIKPDLEKCYEGIVPDYVTTPNSQNLLRHITSYRQADAQYNHLKEEILTDDSFAENLNSDKQLPSEILSKARLAAQGEIKWKDVLDQKITEVSKNASVKKILAIISYQKEKDEARSEIKEILSIYAPIMKDAQTLLRKWEAGDSDVRSLWQMMNGWVYKGFDETYKHLGINFDKLYYESDTYLLGKQIVKEGLEKDVLFKKEDGSVWIDLTEDGLDQKLLLRGDGTSVYMTQDLGTAKLKYEDFKLNSSVYVIADEQNYHMQVLKLILKKLGEPYADGIFHLSYGMVELPTGRMKSREGTVVDADDMVDSMIELARTQTIEAGKTEGFTEDELSKLYETIGLGSLKFYLLRVDPKKKMVFNPQESIDLHGFTAAFVQYAHARICSILRKEKMPLLPDNTIFQSFKLSETISLAEKQLALSLEKYPAVLNDAAVNYDPSVLCNYAFQLAQSFNSFYDLHSIANAENEEKKQLRLMLIVMTAQILRHSMNLLGIRLPEKM